MSMLNLDKLRDQQAAIVEAADQEIALCKERLAETRKRIGIANARPVELAELERRLTNDRQAALVAFDQPTLTKIDKSLKALPGQRADNEKEISDCQLIITGLEAKITAKTFHRSVAEKAIGKLDLQALFPKINQHAQALAEALHEAAPLAASGDVREFFGALPDFLVFFEPFAESEILNPEFKKTHFKYCFDKRFPFVKE